MFIKCSDNKKIKCKNVSLQQAEDCYILTVETSIKYLNYFNENRLPVSLNYTYGLFFNKPLLSIDNDTLPIYRIENNRLFLAFTVWM